MILCFCVRCCDCESCTETLAVLIRGYVTPVLHKKLVRRLGIFRQWMCSMGGMWLDPLMSTFLEDLCAGFQAGTGTKSLSCLICQHGGLYLPIVEVGTTPWYQLGPWPNVQWEKDLSQKYQVPSWVAFLSIVVGLSFINDVTLKYFSTQSLRDKFSIT